MPLNMSELGRNIIQFISNLYVGIFLKIAGLVSILSMLEKDCNGISISTFQPCYAIQIIWPLDWFSLAKSLWNSCAIRFRKLKTRNKNFIWKIWVQLLKFHLVLILQFCHTRQCILNLSVWWSLHDQAIRIFFGEKKSFILDWTAF